ncbi:MAG: homocysteine S-methyltransferase family protein [Deltaproteobacteria bacterium]|nr:homocysteine S-methyltransferase family protein [Deltaproteobacteria bacterium]
MKKHSLLQLIKRRPLVLDGATGTLLQQRGLPPGVSPELWAVEHPEDLKIVHAEYVAAGSDLVYAFTFGANRIKLKEYGLENRVVEINQAAVELALAAANGLALVAGDVGPTGMLLEPVGPLSFDQAVDVYIEQIQAQVAAGAQAVVIETMVDIQEARAALLAAKEVGDVPIAVSMTYQKGRTLTGTDPVTALITLQSMGAHLVGVNCSSGPEEMLQAVKAMYPYARVPLFAKPNAGLPELIDGRTVFRLSAEEFAPFVPEFLKAGAAALGGCCGTNPTFIKKIKDVYATAEAVKVRGKLVSALTSRTKTVFLGSDRPLAMIGDRINPSGKKQMKEELAAGKMDEVRRLARLQAQAGADILDVNVSLPMIDEKKLMAGVVTELTTVVDLPLAIDSFNPEVIEAGVRVFPGRALINSISAEPEKKTRLLKIAKRYGAMFVILPLSSEGVPETARKRISLVRDVIKSAAELGLKSDAAVVDALVMTVSASPEAPAVTLEVVRRVVMEMGLLAMVGLSNVSFGLPSRDVLDAAFLAMCAQAGISLVNINPNSQMLAAVRAACDVLTGRDRRGFAYIELLKHEGLTGTKSGEKMKPVEVDRDVTGRLTQAVLDGDRQGILRLVDTALADGREAFELLDRVLIPAINQVGELFDRGEYFLPQLITSSQAMEAACERLQPMLERKAQSAKGVVVLASVKGDIHDIGKNILALMLRNHGFKVIDLGKDVATGKIVDEAEKVRADIIGLSALMTTTMMEMAGVVQEVRRRNLTAKIVLGGPLVNESFTNKIEADGYANDSVAAVRLISRLLDQGV